MLNYMKKLNYLVILFVLTISLGSAQIGVNTETPDNTSILDVVSSEKGVLFPRMTTTVRNQQLATAAVGLMLYNTTEKCLNINVGTRDLPVWECLKESEAPSGGAGRTPVWGTLYAPTGNNYVLAGKASNTTEINNSRISLFADFSTVFGVDATQGYSRFIAYKLTDTTADQFNIGSLEFMKKHFDLISVVTSASTHVSSPRLHIDLKKFSEEPGKAVFITLSNYPLELTKVFAEYNIVNSNISTSVTGANPMRVVKVPDSPNQQFGNLSVGDFLTTGSSTIVGIPQANLPPDAIVYAVENTHNNAVVFSIKNVFFVGDSSFHEGGIYGSVLQSQINSVTLIKKLTALMLDYVDN